jgi:hypothetical protein
MTKLVTQVELSEGLPAITQKEPFFITALVLVTYYTEPLALVDVPLAEDGAITPEDLAAVLWPAVRGAVWQRFAAAGEPAPATLPVEGLRLAGPSPYLQGRAEILAAAASTRAERSEPSPNGHHSHPGPRWPPRRAERASRSPGRGGPEGAFRPGEANGEQPQDGGGVRGAEPPGKHS